MEKENYRECGNCRQRYSRADVKNASDGYCENCLYIPAVMRRIRRNIQNKLERSLKTQN